MRLNRSNALFDLAGGEVDDHEAVINCSGVLRGYQQNLIAIRY